MEQEVTERQRKGFIVAAAIASVVFTAAGVGWTVTEMENLRRGSESLSWPVVDARVQSSGRGPVVTGGRSRHRTVDVRYEYEWAGSPRVGSTVAIGRPFGWRSDRKAEEFLRPMAAGRTVRAAVDPATGEAVLFPGIPAQHVGSACALAGVTGVGAAVALIALGVARRVERQTRVGAVLFLGSMAIIAATGIYFGFMRPPEVTASAWPVIATWGIVAIGIAVAVVASFRSLRRPAALRPTGR